MKHAEICTSCKPYVQCPDTDGFSHSWRLVVLVLLAVGIPVVVVVLLVLVVVLIIVVIVVAVVVVVTVVETLRIVRNVTQLRKSWIGVSCLCVYCYNYIHVTQTSVTNVILIE